MEYITSLLIKELRLDNVDQATRDSVIEALGAIALERALTMLLLSDENGGLETILKEGDPVLALRYAQENLPYSNELLSSVAAQVILEYTSAGVVQ